MYLSSKTEKATFDFENPSISIAFQVTVSKVAEEMCDVPPKLKVHSFTSNAEPVLWNGL